jgi:hypothetical protein
MPGEFDAEIHGYLPQMLQGALHDLAATALPEPLWREVEAAQQYLSTR